MNEEIEIHDCKACGIRQKVDDLEKSDRQAAMKVVLDVCTKCSDHPNAGMFGSIAKFVGVEIESRWEPRFEE